MQSRASMFPTGNVLDNLAEQAEGSTWAHSGKSAQLYTSWEHARSSARLWGVAVHTPGTELLVSLMGACLF